MVEDPGTSRNNMHENRETSRASAEQADRSAKAQSRNADMHAMEESDCRVVPDEAAEQRGETFGGGGGGKAAAQGERRAIQHPADTARGTGVPGIERRAPSGAGKEDKSGSLLCCIM